MKNTITSSERMDKHLRNIEVIGKKIVGNQFFLNQEDRVLVENLIEIFEKVENGESTKGLLIIGPYGCGKTSIARIVNSYFREPFNFRSTRSIFSWLKRQGEDVVYRYYSGCRGNGNRAMNPRKKWKEKYIIDDLGQEPEFINNYGNKEYVMKEVLLNIYDSFVKYRFKPIDQPTLIITTNMSIEQIGKRHGGDVQSRLIEMCNVFQYSEKSIDKRTLETV